MVKMAMPVAAGEAPVAVLVLDVGEGRRQAGLPLADAGLRRPLLDPVHAAEPAALLAAERLGSGRPAAGRGPRLRVAARTLRRVRRGTDGRPDQGRRREVRPAVRLGLSPVLRRRQVRGRRERPAAVVLQGEPFQRLHRHVRRVLPDGPAVPAVRPVAGQVVPGAVHELRRVASAGSSPSPRTTWARIRTPTASVTAAANARKTTRCRSRRAATCCC